MFIRLTVLRYKLKQICTESLSHDDAGYSTAGLAGFPGPSGLMGLPGLGSSPHPDSSPGESGPDMAAVPVGRHYVNDDQALY